MYLYVLYSVLMVLNLFMYCQNVEFTRAKLQLFYIRCCQLCEIMSLSVVVMFVCSMLQMIVHNRTTCPCGSVVIATAHTVPE